jgi:hypothetical protein
VRAVPVVGSIAINAGLLALMGLVSSHPESPPPREPIEISVIDAPPIVPPTSAPASTAAPASGGHAAHASRHARTTPSAERASPWGDVTVSTEARDGDGDGGNGIGTGIGTGTGLGTGTGIGRDALRDIASLPVPLPSRARPAKLLHPTRQTEVDAAELFAAIVTVDTDGDVVGARMTHSHPGSRGDTAASMIWQFRYSPALDDAGKPVRSTFEQTFAVR